MTPATLLAAAQTLIEGNPDAVGLLDRCNVISRTTSTGSFGETTYSEATVASAVPCLYEERASQTGTLLDGTIYYATHDLFLIISAATKGIKAHYKLVVAARGDNPQLTFEAPVRLDESLGPLVHLAAILKP